MTWYEILEAARELSPDREGVFTAADLHRKLEFPGTAKRSGGEISGSWCAKMAGWGYFERAGVQPNDGKKPIRLYLVSEKGHNAVLRPGVKSQLATLKEAVEKYRDAWGAAQKSPGKKAEEVETKARRELFRVLTDLGST